MMWAHSRSASTAFLRMMIERGDVTVVHEPFLALTEEGTVTLPSSGEDRVARSMKELLALLAEMGRERPVFVKEVVDYEYGYLLDHPGELAPFTHTFMIRDPRQTIASHYAAKPTVTSPEIGYERLWELHELVSSGGRAPLVLRAERLLEDPAAVVEAFCAYAGLPYLPEALHWDAGDRPEWQRHRAWHVDAINSAGFHGRRNAYPDTVDNNPTLTSFYDHHLPFYERLLQHADQPRSRSMSAETAPAPMSTTRESPGVVFARAYAADPKGAEVSFDYSVTEAHEPTKDRPRTTVRNLLKVRPVGEAPVRFWTETRPGPGEAERVNEADIRREAAFRFGMGEAGVRPIRTWVKIPEGLADDPAELAAFIDYRLLVRAATAENQALTYDLLAHPGIARITYTGDGYVRGLLEACDEIEQSGATAHAMIVNPTDYYHRMLGQNDLLAELAAGNGMKVSRNRWVDRGTAIVGDISVAARLLDARRSVIRVEEPPPGTFAEPGLAVCAEVWEGIAVYLPTLFYVVTPADTAE